MHSRNSVPDILFSDNYKTKIKSLAKCNMGIQREQTQKGENLNVEGVT